MDPELPPSKRRASRGPNGTNTLSLPPPTGRFALPPPVPECYEEGGRRKVKPYFYAFGSFAKGRWVGREVLDVYKEWVKDMSPEYYQWAIDSEAIVVNNAKTTGTTILRNGDLLSNVLHRHEPPIVAGKIKILYDGRLPGNDGETLVVVKPGSMPVHTTGRYHFQTLLSILKYEHDLPLVHTSNRLDRLTSGVMVCALTVEGSKRLGAWFNGSRAADGGVKKEYVARCRGEVPDGVIVCEQPLLTINSQIGINIVHPDGKPAKTVFRRLSYDSKSNTSVVHCFPITGRTHQIRLHLQSLGHPIANDPIYGALHSFGREEALAFSADQVTEETRRVRRERGERLLAKNLAENEVVEEVVEEGVCGECFMPLVVDEPGRQLFIYLHALRYTTTEWDWSSEMPYWALEGYQPPEL